MEEITKKCIRKAVDDLRELLNETDGLLYKVICEDDRLNNVIDYIDEAKGCVNHLWALLKPIMDEEKEE